MLQEIEQLLILQDRDSKIRTLNNELKYLPQERVELEKKLAATKEKFESSKQRSKEIEVARKKLENDAQAKRDSIAKFKTQQFQTRKNEEFQALGNEIKRYEGDIRSIEDQELGLMEDAEKAKGEIKIAEAEFNGASTLIERQLSDLDAKTKAIEAQVAELIAEREKLAAQFNEDLLYRYDRLMKSKGDAAVVPVEHEVCMGCHMKITTQTVHKVKAEKEIVQCEQCGRILYHNY